MKDIYWEIAMGLDKGTVDVPDNEELNKKVKSMNYIRTLYRAVRNTTIENLKKNP